METLDLDFLTTPEQLRLSWRGTESFLHCEMGPYVPVGARGRMVYPISKMSSQGPNAASLDSNPQGYRQLVETSDGETYWEV